MYILIRNMGKKNILEGDRETNPGRNYMIVKYLVPNFILLALRFQATKTQYHLPKSLREVLSFTTTWPLK